MEVLPQQGRAEAVNGADARAGQQHLLPLQPEIVGVGGDPFGQGGAQPLFHFRRCRPGKGDDQHPVDIDRMLRIGNPPDDAFHQHGGFSRAGGCGYQQCAAARFDALALFGCPVSLRHGGSLLS